MKVIYAATIAPRDGSPHIHLWCASESDLPHPNVMVSLTKSVNAEIDAVRIDPGRNRGHVRAKVLLVHNAQEASDLRREMVEENYWTDKLQEL